MLVDSSVWMDHLRHSNAYLRARLESLDVWIHPFIIGEIACGSLAHCGQVLMLLNALPCIDVLDHEEVLSFVERRALFSRGLGWVDMHLLGSAAAAHMPLWTRDKRLAAAARELGLTPA